jgi:hypothetical protein
MSLNLSAGISCLCMNRMVSVALTRPLMPCANLPNSSAADYSKHLEISGVLDAGGIR